MELSFFSSIDWIIVACILVLMTWHMTRGVFKTLISLAIWLIALMVAQISSFALRAFLTPYITDPELLSLLPFLLIFVFSVLFLNLITSFLRLDIGIVTGAAGRLLAFVCSLPLILVQFLVLLQIAYLLAIDDTYDWHLSQLVPYVEQLEVYWEAWIFLPICFSLMKGSCVG